MTVPFFDIGRLNATIAGEISAAVERVLGSGWYILGREGEAFERAMTAQLGTGKVLGCNSGTDSLVLSLLAAGIGPGDEVVTVAHTAIPTVAAICSVGATPVLVDVDSRTWVIDPAQVTRALSPLTKGVVAVHLYGNMADIVGIRKALADAGRSEIAIIEDVAQAQGALLLGRSAGTIGRFGAFSFYPSKNIGALGDGGAVACQSDEDADRVTMLRNYGQRDRYHAELSLGINSRLDELQAAILAAKLPHLATWNTRKKELMARYRSSLAGLPLSFQQVTAGCEPAWHLCVVALEEDGMRERLQGHLTGDGVQTLVHYPIPNHRQPAFVHAKWGELPVTDDLAGRILSLPLSPVLTDDEQNQVIQSIEKFFRCR